MNRGGGRKKDGNFVAGRIVIADGPKKVDDCPVTTNVTLTLKATMQPVVVRGRGKRRRRKMRRRAEGR